MPASAVIQVHVIGPNATGVVGLAIATSLGRAGRRAQR